MTEIEMEAVLADISKNDAAATLATEHMTKMFHNAARLDEPVLFSASVYAVSDLVSLFGWPAAFLGYVSWRDVQD